MQQRKRTADQFSWLRQHWPEHGFSVSTVTGAEGGSQGVFQLCFPRRRWVWLSLATVVGCACEEPPAAIANGTIEDSDSSCRLDCIPPPGKPASLPSVTDQAEENRVKSGIGTRWAQLWLQGVTAEWELAYLTSPPSVHFVHFFQKTCLISVGKGGQWWLWPWPIFLSQPFTDLNILEENIRE